MNLPGSAARCNNVAAATKLQLCWKTQAWILNIHLPLWFQVAAKAYVHIIS